ncbi:MAG: energy-coupled thiamine transporter ThiT [Oscillospiraceae bacterium]|nr:energy-coupled thiamine transporter ThiT [Oscillospiraceae bacterium]
MSNTNTHNSRTHLRALTEAALFVAIAVVLHLLRFPVPFLPQSGSVSFILVPLVFLSVRWGLSWGLISCLAFGILRGTLLARSFWGWQSLMLDHVVAVAVIGFAGLFYRKGGIFPALAVVFAGALQFAVHFLSGWWIFYEWMPPEFAGMAMTNPMVYSLIYNATYMVPSIVISAVAIGILTKPLGKYFRGEDLA